MSPLLEHAVQKVYMAAPFAKAPLMQKYAAELEATGKYKVVSRWHTGAHDGEAFKGGDRAGMYKEASEDLDDLDSADILIAFTQAPNTKFSSGGRHVEFGYALASCRTTYVVGPVENVFHNMASEVFEKWELALEALSPEQLTTA